MLVPQAFSDRSVSVIGLGYVGLTLAATMASVGFRVVGVERRQDVVDSLRQGRATFHEPGLEDMLRRTLDSGNLAVVGEMPASLDATVHIVTVGTPLDGNGRARLDMIENATRQVAAVLKSGDLVVLRSTVRIGTTRQVVEPILRATGHAFDLAFCPERTLEGVALEELRRLPQIVGAVTSEATVRAAQVFQFITPTTVRVQGVETAEMIKLIDNAQRDVSFAYANEVARACDAVGISAAEVISAGKLGYPRTNLPMPGPVGGPCLEKDSYILAEGLESHGIVPEMTLAARRLNEAQPADSMAALANWARRTAGFPERPVVSLLGLAFKGRPATDDLRGTMARPILSALREQFPGATLRGFDPVVAAAEVEAFGLEPMPSLAAALAGANVAVIANNHPAFGGMALETLARTMARPGLVYDFWNNFDSRSLRMPAGTGYMALGSHGLARVAEG